MTDIVERLRVWPAAYGEDGFSSSYVGQMAKNAADEIERLRTGLKAIVDLKNPLPRAAVREACAELLAGCSTPQENS